MKRFFDWVGDRLTRYYLTIILITMIVIAFVSLFIQAAIYN